MIYDFFCGVYEKGVNYVKKTINNYYTGTDYSGYVEKNIFSALDHGFFFALGSYLFYDKSWLYDLSMIWDSSNSFSSYIYYYLYITRYLVKMKQLDKKEKDYNIFFTHHLMTLVLLGVSFFRFMKIGIIIALSHDLADIFLGSAKAANKIYEISKNYYCYIITNICLVFFLISWIFTRIVLNYNILEYLIINKGISLNHFFTGLYIDEQISFLLLLVNFGLQLYWQVIIINFIHNIFIGKKPKDEKGITYTIKKE